MRIILEAKYKKADLKKVMIEQCQHSSLSERANLRNILKKFEYLFDGNLGTWNTALVYLEIKDDAKSVCLRTYPVPRVHKAMFRN